MLGQETPYHPLKVASSKEVSKLTLCCRAEKTQYTYPNSHLHPAPGNLTLQTVGSKRWGEQGTSPQEKCTSLYQTRLPSPTSERAVAEVVAKDVPRYQREPTLNCLGL